MSGGNILLRTLKRCRAEEEDRYDGGQDKQNTGGRTEGQHVAWLHWAPSHSAYCYCTYM